MKSAALALFCCIFLHSTSATTCKGSYENCNLGDPTKLNVHLVPHTHDDVGWLKTVDEYYYGANNSIQHAGVQYILDTVIPHLLENQDRRFIYVEIAFFYRWWREQSSEVQEQVKMLVNQGRFEFILGGWCMNDEAAAHYNAIIDQMSLGLQFLNKTFGACGRPRVAWQIDPFGHSREQASLFAQMGFDGLFFGRLDYQDKNLRMKERRMEEVWRGSESLSPPIADLFTGVNENGYNPPGGFCFDEYCSDDPIMDDPELEGYNVDEKVKAFQRAANDQAKHFRTNHIMMTMGSDFQYGNAHKWYKNLDKLIKYVNSAKNSNITAFYSTPSCYLYALNQANLEWTIKTDDFFPYASLAHEFWTGYFASRPALKGYIRESNKILQVCNQMEALGGRPLHLKNKKRSGVSSERLREAMAVAQHHDAVSGTEKQHVADDYAKRLYQGRQVCKAVVSNAITGKDDGLHFCDYLNISLCDFTEKQQKFSVVIYNPLAREITTLIRLPIADDGGMFAVVNSATNTPSLTQIIPVSMATLLTRRDSGNANSELIFKVDLPALGYTEYIVTKTNYTSSVLKKFNHRTMRKDIKGSDVTIANEFYKVQFDGNTGLIKTIANIDSGITLPVTQKILWYNASVGNEASNQVSGAYIFRPNSSTPFNCTQSGVAQLQILEGNTPLVQEVYQKFSDWAWQVIRLYTGMRYVEVEWTIGPIPFKDGFGKEIISRYETPLATAMTFYTDANGREILQRKRNYRPTWSLNQTEPVSGNYYPVNSRIYINDSQTQFTILADRSQGGSSLKDGSLELMIHRRLLLDDGKGVGEHLNETGQFGDGLVVRGKHWLILDSVKTSARQHRLMAEQIFMSPLVAFHSNATLHRRLISSITAQLPLNIHLLTLATQSDDSILIRLEHQFALNEDSELSKSVTIPLKDIFGDLNLLSVEEMLLGGNVKKDDVTRLSWKVEEKSFDFKNNQKFLDDDLSVILNPMQIRTFKVILDRK